MSTGSVVVIFVAVIAGLALLQLMLSRLNSGELSGSDDAFHPDGWEGAGPDYPGDLYNPLVAREPLPAGYRPVLSRDSIRPVYAPKFRRADDIDWSDNELIIGVEIDGDARAYPVGFLNRREIVVDLHRGIPTFVTW